MTGNKQLSNSEIYFDQFRFSSIGKILKLQLSVPLKTYTKILPLTILQQKSKLKQIMTSSIFIELKAIF